MNTKSESDFENLYQVVSQLQTVNGARIFLNDFLTRSELSSLVKRLTIALMLGKNSSYGEIRKRTGASSATIASVSDMMQKRKKGFLLAIKQVEAEEWAEKTSQKISVFFKHFSPFA